MKYLLFDQYAISTYISDYSLQSIEFAQGKRFIKHICGEISSEIFCNTVVEYNKNGILFVGNKGNQSGLNNDEFKLFCIDLTTCNILSESSNPSDLLTIIQKTLDRVLF